MEPDYRDSDKDGPLISECGRIYPGPIAGNPTLFSSTAMSFTIQSLQTYRFLYTNGKEQKGGKVQMVPSLNNDLDKIVKTVVPLLHRDSAYYSHNYRSSPQVVHSKVTFLPL